MYRLEGRAYRNMVTENDLLIPLVLSTTCIITNKLQEGLIMLSPYPANVNNMASSYQC